MCHAYYRKNSATVCQIREPTFPIRRSLDEDLSCPAWQSMIKEIIEQSDYTYTRLARELKISRSTLARMRHDLNYQPRANVIWRLLAIYFSLQS